MGKGYVLEGDEIVLQRELTSLDLFVKDFIEILQKHTGYLIVSGYISISTGRPRGTEDVDVLVPLLGEKTFNALFKELRERGFWCYQGDHAKGLLEQSRQLTPLRFAREKEVFPNIEFIPFDETKKAKLFEFNHPQNMRVGDFLFKTAPLEFEILYKELVLAGKKDKEDALHLRNMFQDILDETKLKEYAAIVREELR
ncbi:MAG: hypothetical protein GXP63_00790 [DPANN group archaeon]|nr:hypothetical protein [DPANN group archaeon]